MWFYVSDFKSRKFFEGMLIELGIPEKDVADYDEIEVNIKLPQPSAVKLILDLEKEK
jgi:hypothetical protein